MYATVSPHEWGLSTGEKLQEERERKREKGSRGRKARGSSNPPE
jgi:hypothetical protein